MNPELDGVCLRCKRRTGWNPCRTCEPIIDAEKTRVVNLVFACWALGALLASLFWAAR